MESITYNDLIKNIRSGIISPHQIYDFDISYEAKFSTEHYLKTPEDNINNSQKLSKAFTDIEVYCNHKDEPIHDWIQTGKYPITAITLYSTKDKKYYCFFRPYNLKNFPKTEIVIEYLKKESRKNIQIEENKSIRYLDDEDIELKLYDNSDDLILDYWKKVREIDFCVLSGFNCLEENQSVWLNNKIIKIKDIKTGNELNKYGNVERVANTGYKNEYEILLSTGHKIKCSKKHIFPFYKKESHKYKDYRSLLKTEQEKSVENILKIKEGNDLYLKIEKHKNINPNLSFRELIINNFKIFKQYDFFNFILSDVKIYDYLNQNNSKKRKLRTDNFWKRNISKYSFKELKNKIPEDMIIEFLRNNDIIWFLFTKQKTQININTIINNDILQLLGLIYTDGCFSHNNFTIYNSSEEILNSYGVGRGNYVMLLYPLIYHHTNVKNISTELCSQLSIKQFQSLFSGMIDGGGCLSKNSICFDNYETEIESNINNISELLIWNGIIPTLPNRAGKFKKIYINCSQYTKSFIDGLKFHHREKNKQHRELKYKIIKNRKSNKIKIQELEDYALIKIKDIYKTDKKVKMFDIETTKHLFNSSHGIVTHNSHTFDYPYLYYCLLKKYKNNHKKVAKIISQFETVNIRDDRDRAGRPIKLIQPIDYPICDLMYFYLPREDGGLNLGKKQSSYTLDYISKQELGISKLEYAQEGLTLDQFWEKDSLNYLLYNFWDVALCKKLDDKLQMIDMYNMIRRSMNTSMSTSLRGSSPLFDSYVYNELHKEGNYVRYGINLETDFDVPKKMVDKIYRPKAKIKWEKVEKLTSRETKLIMNRFPGAYVKDPKPIITTSGFVTDLDASRLYPSMINQFNISFDTFFGRIISSNLYDLINFLQKYMGTKPIIPNPVYIKLFDGAKNYIENKITVQNKNDSIIQTYYTITTLLQKLLESGKKWEDISNPITLNNYMILRVYLIQFLDLLQEIHSKESEYIPQVYDYLINNKSFEDDIWIIENYNNPNVCLNKIKGPELLSYLDKNKLGITLTGTLFKIHEEKLGLFYKFLDEKYLQRKEYKKIRDSFPEGTSDYKLFDRRQYTMKVLMNSTYGLFGMASYRYSNKWLAKTITTQGRLCLKTAQYFADKYLRNEYDK